MAPHLTLTRQLRDSAACLLPTGTFELHTCVLFMWCEEVILGKLPNTQHQAQRAKGQPLRQ